MGAGPPFGSDTLIALASNRRQIDLELGLSLINGRAAPEELLTVLRSKLQPGDLLAVITYATRP